jgi:hypothetical protein
MLVAGRDFGANPTTAWRASTNYNAALLQSALVNYFRADVISAICWVEYRSSQPLLGPDLVSANFIPYFAPLPISSACIRRVQLGKPEQFRRGLPRSIVVDRICDWLVSLLAIIPNPPATSSRAIRSSTVSLTVICLRWRFLFGGVHR